MANWWLESKSQSHNHGFDGRIDEVAIWDIALTDNEVST